MGRAIEGVLTVVILFLIAVPGLSQDRRSQLGLGSGQHTLFGDLRVDEGDAKRIKPLVYEVVLYNTGGTRVANQFVNSGGRYQFQNLGNGTYELAVVLENEEVARTRVDIMAPFKNDFRQDLNLAWKHSATDKPGSISVADFYKRSDANEELFRKAKQATDQKLYDDAVKTLQQIVAADPKDFQAWAELGTVFLFKQSYDDSESAYKKSIGEKPDFFLAQMNLGKLRSIRKNYEGAIEPLTAAVTITPQSADANYYLGEAYLQVKKGSKGVVYLNEALKLDPVGRADVHLRLAALYHAVGAKDKAAEEYKEYLKKKTEYENRKKLEQYIEENKPKSEGAKP